MIVSGAVSRYAVCFVMLSAGLSLIAPRSERCNAERSTTLFFQQTLLQQSVPKSSISAAQPMDFVSASASANRRLTTANNNHLLTNVNVWSHDSKWIYYDVRSDPAGSLFDGHSIERVNVETGQVEVVYKAPLGAKVGVVTANPVADQCVFIHGPESPTEEWSYSAYHRRGVIAGGGKPRSVCNLDARDIVAPFTSGALRGGSHVHVFSGDGQWVSFTYEDHVLATTNEESAEANQRGVGVSVPVHLVVVPKTHPRNHDGEFFSVLVTRTWDSPVAGSDEINRAYSDAWVGSGGYTRTDGTHQTRAIAFIGDCISARGETVPELFVVDIPDDVTVPEESIRSGPLCGTATTRPVVPRSTRQRRLTDTTDRKFPGLSTQLRHWPRSSPDGAAIAFLMRDENGVIQLWLISPTGRDQHQLTNGINPIESAFTFRPDGQKIACVISGRVCEVDAKTGTVVPLTPENPLLEVNVNPRVGPPRPEACVYSPDGRSIAYMRSVEQDGTSTNQIFVTPSSL